MIKLYTVSNNREVSGSIARIKLKPKKGLWSSMAIWVVVGQYVNLYTQTHFQTAVNLQLFAVAR